MQKITIRFKFIIFSFILLGCNNDMVELKDPPPVKIDVTNISASPLLEASQPWEVGLIGYCTVLRNNPGEWQMWYESFEPAANDDYNSYLCYATSTDGVNWIKPDLGLVDYNGNTNNNILFAGKEMKGIHGPYVFIEDNQYHLLVNQIDKGGSDPEYFISISSSDDGINWGSFRNIYKGYSDTQNTLLDFKTEKRLFVRKWIGGVSVGERAVGLAKKLKNVRSLFFDQAKLAVRNNFDEDIYTNGAVNLNDDLILCFISIFNKPQEEIYLDVAYSEDGETFLKFDQNIIWPKSSSAWAQQAQYASPSLIPADNDSTYYLYYSGTQKKHNTPITSNKDYITGVGRYKITISTNEE